MSSLDVGIRNTNFKMCIGSSSLANSNNNREKENKRVRYKFLFIAQEFRPCYNGFRFLFIITRFETEVVHQAADLALINVSVSNLPDLADSVRPAFHLIHEIPTFHSNWAELHWTALFVPWTGLTAHFISLFYHFSGPDPICGIQHQQSPEKKRKRRKTMKKPSPTPQSTSPNPSLPDDLVLSCIARVSRLDYPTLSLVSKSFRSLVASPELYKIRSSLGCTESCLYVCLQEKDSDPNPRWFTLCRKPNRTLTNDITEKKRKKKSSGYALAAIPVLHSRPAQWSGLVAVGSNIYNIGGPIDKAHSSIVSILDCQSHTWGEAPSMRVERNYPAANVLDGKIYVTGGCKDCSNASNWMEVFDPKTQTWEPVSSPGAEIGGCSIHKSAVVEGEIFFANSEGFVYEPKEGRWKRMGWEMDSDDWVWYSYCVVENVLYNYYCGEFKWYDTKVRLWKNLKGVKGLPRFARCGGKMVDYGGKMAVFWDKIVTSDGCKNKMILCAVIALERRNSEEIWGKVEWHDTVLTVPMSYKVVCALSPTV